MPLTTSYTIVPFLRGRDGKLGPSAPRRAGTRGAAIAAADQLAPFYAGIIVLKEESDPIEGAILEPVLVCVIGDVPDDLLIQLAA